MNIDALVPWSTDLFSRSPMYEPLRPWAEKFSAFSQWPDLQDYQRLLEAQPEPILTLGGKPLKIVPEEGRPHCFEEHYAPRIYLTGEIQTRRENWHDFFQFLTWFLFPRTKAQINAMHLPRARERLAEGGDLGRRSPLENMLSLFDEGGAVVVSSDESLLQLIRDFQWKRLFWERREEVNEKLQCITFGHAVFEKGLLPYLGMTANCILLPVEESFHHAPWAERLAIVDERLTAILARGERYVTPKDLSPLPILGMPGWSEENRTESYYDNKDYFRIGRRRI